MATELFYGYFAADVDVSCVADEINETYAPVLQDLLPTGPAWNFDQDSDEYALLRALSYHCSRIEIRGHDLLREFDPTTMNELLSDWERVLNLPGDNPSPPSTLSGRRSAVHARLLGYGDPNYLFYEGISEGLGYVDPIVLPYLFTPAVANSAITNPLTNNTNGGWSFAWLVLAITSSLDDTLEWQIDKLTPAHTIALYTFVSSWLEDEVFDAWTGDDPDGWTVTEDTGNQEITQVGSGESYGGSGTGSCNIYSSDDSGTVEIELTAATTFPDDGAYIVVAEVSYLAGGPLYVWDTDSPSNFYSEITSAGRHAFWFYAADSTSHLAIGAESVAVNATVDRVRVIGPIDYLGTLT